MTSCNIERRLGSLLTLAGFCLMMTCGADIARGDWSAVSLLPPGRTECRAHAASGGDQFGWVRVGLPHASLWNGSAGTWVDINPSGAVTSTVYGAAGGQQVGFSRTNTSGLRAALWTGSSASYVNLNPTGANSEANATDGTQQVGYVVVSGANHAALWSGSSTGWVDLNPTGSTLSNAYCIADGQQGGIARVANLTRASVWSGTAASWVDLSPPNSTLSAVNAISNGQQGGFAIVGNQHATLWSGSAGSMIDLHPATNGPTSAVLAMKNGMQVGYAYVNGLSRAAFWQGTAASWVNLNTYLPANYSSAQATAISVVGDTINVTGYARNSTSNLDEAILWTSQVEPPVVCNDVDFNNDGSFFDPQDIDALLSVYAEGNCIPEAATCDDIDFNNDTSVFDPCDIDSFLLVFSEGPCTPCGQ